MRGRYKIFFVFICSVVHSAVFSQVAIGLRGGANLSSVSGSLYHSKPGFHAGTFVEIPLKGRFYLQPEFIFSQKGGETSLNEKSIYYNSLTKSFYRRQALIANYLDLNVLLKYRLTGGLFLLAGPQISFLIYDRYKFNNGPNERDYYNFTEASRKLNLGFSAGATYEFNNGLSVGVRRDFGFLPVFVNGDAIRTSVFQLTAGFKIVRSRRYRSGISQDEELFENGDVSVNE